jgi:hypothetical protein
MIGLWSEYRSCSLLATHWITFLYHAKKVKACVTIRALRNKIFIGKYCTIHESEISTEPLTWICFDFMGILVVQRVPDRRHSDFPRRGPHRRQGARHYGQTRRIRVPCNTILHLGRSWTWSRWVPWHVMYNVLRFTIVGTSLHKTCSLLYNAVRNCTIRYL